jgi:hypothetical protein
VKIINAHPYGFVSSKAIEEFERRINKNLTQDYRAFLLEYNGGRPMPSFFWIKPKEDGSAVYQFYGLHDGPKHLSIDTCISQESYGIPSSMLPIGDDGLGNFICIGISPINQGKIYFLDHDLHPYQFPDSPKGIKKLADSFNGFLACLIESPDE